MTDINQYNKEDKPHGYWENYWDSTNKFLFYKGYYDNGFAYGYWEYYHTDGKLWAKGNYNNNVEIGYWEYYDKNGELETQILYA